MSVFELYSQDGKKVTVKTEADRKEYIASGFYSAKPFNDKGGREEDKDKPAPVEIEDAEFVEVDEEESEEDKLRDEYFALFGKKAGNMKLANIKAAIAEAAKGE